ncbi:MAG: hypothetical protein LBM27_03030 [Lactobacillaceae bacterium]|nr:hypothetical protein [Lactobacillaceae bacterium]
MNLTRIFKSDQFSITAIPLIASTPIGVQVPRFTSVYDGKLLIKYEVSDSEAFLKDFLLTSGTKTRLVVALNLIRLIQSLSISAVAEIEINNLVINRNLNLRFIHLGIDKMLIPQKQTTDFLKLKNLILHILESGKVGLDLLTPVVSENQFVSTISQVSGIAELESALLDEIDHHKKIFKFSTSPRSL